MAATDNMGQQTISISNTVNVSEENKIFEMENDEVKTSCEARKINEINVFDCFKIKYKLNSAPRPPPAVKTYRRRGDLNQSRKKGHFSGMRLYSKHKHLVINISLFQCHECVNFILNNLFSGILNLYLIYKNKEGNTNKT